MVASYLENILKLFESYFKCTLVADEKQTCLVRASNGVEIQIELNRYGLLLIGCQLGQVNGRYQDLLFKAALKANYLQNPSTGSFGFSHKYSTLILFRFIEPHLLEASEIPKILDPFLIKAKEWSLAIKNSEIPTIQESKEKLVGAKLFGL